MIPVFSLKNVVIEYLFSPVSVSDFCKCLELFGVARAIQDTYIRNICLAKMEYLTFEEVRCFV